MGYFGSQLIVAVRSNQGCQVFHLPTFIYAHTPKPQYETCYTTSSSWSQCNTFDYKLPNSTVQVKAKLHHSSWIAKMLYSAAYNTKLFTAKNRTMLGLLGEGAGQGADWLVFSNVQKQLGGRVR